MYTFAKSLYFLDELKHLILSNMSCLSFKSVDFPQWCSSCFLPVFKLYLVCQKKKKDSCVMTSDSQCLFFHVKALSLYSVQANVNEALALHTPILLSPEPEGIQTAYFYTHRYPAEKGKEEFIKPEKKKRM